MECSLSGRSLVIGRCCREAIHLDMVFVLIGCLVRVVVCGVVGCMCVFVCVCVSVWVGICVFGGVYVEYSLVIGHCWWAVIHLDMVFVLIGCFGGGLWSYCVCCVCVCVCVCVLCMCVLLLLCAEFGKTNPLSDKNFCCVCLVCLCIDWVFRWFVELVVVFVGVCGLWG